MTLLVSMRSSGEHLVAAELAARGREQGALVEATRSAEVVKGFGMEQRLVQRYAQRVKERCARGVRAERLQKGVSTWVAWVGSLMEAAILWYGGNRVIDGALSLGVFSGFLAIRGMLEVPVGSLVSVADSWIHLRGALARSDDILSATKRPEGTRVADAITGHLELQGVGFRYGSGGAWVFRNLNLTIATGERIALVGPSGHGKSTLGKLLVGLLTPTEGVVLLDGHPVTEYATQSLAERLGVVLQEPLIFEGEVREAIALKAPNATPEAVVQAARVACFDTVVQKMPQGYASKVNSSGSNLSGGERQRLAIAQAVLHQPAVLLLDEATSALDPETETRVLKNLKTLNCTTICIAHREAAVAASGRVFRIAEGEFQELSAPIASHVATNVGTQWEGG
jgi:ABC-type bacteriocin/lantibiotic exporter with double-glycine peptidase domain